MEGADGDFGEEPPSKLADDEKALSI